jgi:glycosyltransferase involved in cell wall biosynthesis
MKKTKISIVIPLRKPQPEVFSRIKKMLKEQTIKAEIVENWHMPEAKSLNTGIKRAKGEIIVTLCGDCVPEDKFWLEKLIQPLEDKKVVASVSDLYLPEEYWKKYPFLIKIFTLPDRKIRKPSLDFRACAFRKKDLEKAGLFDEDLKVVAIEVKLAETLMKMGKIVRANVKIFHLHKYENVRKLIFTFYNYSNANGRMVKEYGINLMSFWVRIIRAIPFLGIVSITYRFPFKKYWALFPVYFIIAVPVIHIVNIYGFWKGFFLKPKDNIRNTEVLNKLKKI